jgi:hypothetical protein
MKSLKFKSPHSNNINFGECKLCLIRSTKKVTEKTMA